MKRRRSLSRARAKLLGDRSEIADDETTRFKGVVVVVVVICARARKASSFSRRRRRREESIQTFFFSRTFFFPETRGRQTTEEKQRDKEILILTERGDNDSFSSSAIRISILRAITAAASVAARV